MSYYWFNRQEIQQKAKERYSKEKAAEQYLKNNRRKVKKSIKVNKRKVKKSIQKLVRRRKRQD